MTYNPAMTHLRQVPRQKKPLSVKIFLQVLDGEKKIPSLTSACVWRWFQGQLGGAAALLCLRLHTNEAGTPVAN